MQYNIFLFCLIIVFRKDFNLAVNNFFWNVYKLICWMFLEKKVEVKEERQNELYIALEQGKKTLI